MLTLVLLLLSFFFLVLSAFNVGLPRINPLGVGLALYVLAGLVPLLR